MTDMAEIIEGFAARQAERRTKREATLDRLKQVTIAVLRAAKIATVEITFDGYGDSGTIEDITCIAMDGGVTDCPQRQVELTLEEADNGWAAAAMSLSEALEDVGYIALELHHPGWEINEGSSGALEIDVAKGAFTLECRTRFIDYDEQVTEI